MQLGYTILNIVLLWVNTYSTFKTLNRKSNGTQKGGARSSRLQQRSKREMKTCLSVWVVWVCWRTSERVVDNTIGIVIPFLHEIKCLILLFLIIARSWATEPLVLKVLRPAIRPYVGIIDSLLHWLELAGDFLFLLLGMPYHLFMSWWYGSEEDVDVEAIPVQKPSPPTVESDTLLATPPQTAPEEFPLRNQPEPTPTSVTQAVIEAHRKEQEEQAINEAKIREIQERSARDRAAHLRRVAGPPPSVANNNLPSSRTLQAAMRNSKAASTTDLPDSVMNTGTIVSRRPPERPLAPAPPPVPLKRSPSFIRDDTDSATERESTPSIYPSAALVMPVPVKAQRPSTRPAVHANSSVVIPRPNNPGPQIPSVVVPMALSSKTLPRLPTSRPALNDNPIPSSRTLGAKSSQTLRSKSSFSSTSTLPVSEFGVSTHKREGAGAGSEQEGSSTTTDGESQATTDSGTKAQRWDEFMESLAQVDHTSRSNQAVGGHRHEDNIPNDDRSREEIVERIVGMKREVEEKLQRIADHTSTGRERGAFKPMTTTVGVYKNTNAQPIIKPPLPLPKNATITVGARVNNRAANNTTTESSKQNIITPIDGGSRRRKAAGPIRGAGQDTPPDEEAIVGAMDSAFPNKRRKDEEDDEDDVMEVDVDDETMATASMSPPDSFHAFLMKVSHGMCDRYK
ncbi:hypothetical protein FRB91_010575 [Serendipita sp. 411]|nr:hypothetical protein FRB91_010575 [Serendipita sp. 411]